MVFALNRPETTSGGVLSADDDAGASSAPSTGELVAELSHLEYASRAWQSRRTQVSVARAEGGVESLILRKNAALVSLRSRGANFLEAGLGRPSTSKVPGATAQDGVPPREPTRPSEANLQSQIERLEQSLNRAKVLGLAVGILMERHEIAPNDAFGLLCAASNDSKRKIGDIAADLCETRALP